MRPLLHTSASLLIVLSLGLVGQIVLPPPVPAVPPEVDLAGLVSIHADLDPCSDGPDRSYDVVALRVPISYNNWGDFDPHGRLFVLAENVVPLSQQVADNLVEAGLDTLADAVEQMAQSLDDLGALPGDAIGALSGLPDPAALQPVQDDLTNALRDILLAAGVDPDPNKVGEAIREAPPLGRFAPSPLVQPFVVRAVVGECVEFRLLNTLPEPVGMQLAGLVARPGQGGAVSTDAIDFTAPLSLHTYTVGIPALPGMEGAHILTSPTDVRYHTKHGLFGTLVAEPAGSSWTAPDGSSADSGTQAIITNPGAADFREFVTIYHDEVELLDRSLRSLPTISPFGEYGPGSKAINLRAEPFMDRLKFHDDMRDLGVTARGHDKSQAYGSYAYGDPAADIPKSYVGDPAKFRLVNVGPGQSHTHHLHGGGDRWRASPVADDTQFDDGFLKTNPVIASTSERVDVQNLAPGESYNAEIEGGSGGVQQSVGDFLFHCHIVEHYVSGMWSFWRVFNTRQAGLAELPDRATPTPYAVPAKNLVGKTLPGGVVVTAANLASIVESQLPPQGVPSSDEDASVWDWIKTTNPAGQVRYWGEPETDVAWPNYASPTPGQRPQILFNPDDGKLAYPFLKPHFGERPPFAPDHGPAPYLTPDVTSTQPKGLCPSGAPQRDYTIVAMGTRIDYNDDQSDTEGQIFVHASDVDDVEADPSKATSLVLRANQGDCVDITFSSKLDPASSDYSKVNMHIHLVQFDIQGSDGVITGFNYETSVKPAATTASLLDVAVAATDDTDQITVDDATQFTEGTTIAIGLNEETIEIRRIVDKTGNVLTLDDELENDHPVGTLVGYEFVRYRWYPDVELGIVYWHDHVDGLNSWRRGLFGGIVIEPNGSKWCDPKRPDAERTSCGDVLDGHFLDIVAGSGGADSYREIVLQVQDRACVSLTECSAVTQNPQPPIAEEEPASINLRSAPFFLRDPQYPLSSTAGGNGDPDNVWESYPGDDVRIRLLYAGQSTSTGIATFGAQGHRFQFEQNNEGSRSSDRVTFGEASMHNLRLECGAGGCGELAGDYAFGMTQPDLLRRGAWGIFRVHDATLNSASGGGLQLLPNNLAPSPGSLPADTDPEVTGVRSYDISAFEAEVDLNRAFGIKDTLRLFAPATDREAIQSGAIRPMPLVLRALPGEIVEVTLHNDLPAGAGRVGITPSLLWAEPGDGLGTPVGDNADDTVAPGGSRTYRWYVDREVGAAYLTSFGDPDGHALSGLYGALIVEPEGSTFSNELGMTADLTLADGTQVREHVLQYATDDPLFESSNMKYFIDLVGPATVNYRTEPLGNRVGVVLPGIDDVTAPTLGGVGIHSCHIEPQNCGLDLVRQEVRNPLNPLSHYLVPPETPILTAPQDRGLVIRTLIGAGDQTLVPALQGHWWAVDPDKPGCRTGAATCGSNLVSARNMGAGDTDNAWIAAPGPGGPGDYLYADGRGAMHEAGAWGLLRVCPAATPIVVDVDGEAILGNAGSTIEQDVDVDVDLAALGPAVTCVAAERSDPVFDILREQVAAAIQEAVAGILANSGDPNALALAVSEAIFNTALQNNVCRPNTESLPGNGDTSMPPGAATAPRIPGFIPGCVVMESDHTFTIHSRDAIPHNPGSLEDLAQGDLGGRCFRHSRDVGGNQNAGANFVLGWRYDGTTLEVSTDGGATWRDCTDAMDPDSSDQARAVVPFRCDIHNGMVGQVVVEA